MNSYNFVDYYSLLEVNKSASDEVIKIAYMAMVKEYKPDSDWIQFESMTVKMQLLTDAFNVLCNDLERAKYDKLYDEYYLEHNKENQDECSNGDCKQPQQDNINISNKISEYQEQIDSSNNYSKEYKRNFLIFGIMAVIVIMTTYITLSLICSKISKTLSNRNDFIIQAELPEEELYSENKEIYDEGGNKYIGQTYNGKYYGNGFMVFSNGDTYDGSWKEDKMDGYGTYTGKEFGKYEGNWKDDNMNGEGIFYFLDGGKYVGNFIDGNMNGKGVYYYPDGGVYVGDWVNNIREGQGIYYYKNNDRYVGSWSNDNMNGPGAIYHANGQIQQGIWKNGVVQ